MFKKDVSDEQEELSQVYKSFNLSERTQETPMLRVMALHALLYCERLFYLEEVEEIRIADANVFSGRALHEKLDKGPENYSIELASEKLGIRGKADCIRKESGQLIVFEHKKGRSKDGKEAWPSDRLQVLAYSLLLAENTGQVPVEARIKYHGDRKTILIPLNYEEALVEVNSAVENAGRLRNSNQRPPVTVSEKLCRTCSLAPVCLPEEERFAADEERLPRRFFPQDDDRKVIHLVEQGCVVRKEGEQFLVTFPDGRKKLIPGMTVAAIILHGNVQITTQAIHFCAANDIGVHWLSFGGFYVGALAPGAGPVQRRCRQFTALSKPELKIDLCQRLVQAKIENQLKYLLRLTRGDESLRSEPIEKGLNNLRSYLKNLSNLDKSVCTFDDGSGPEALIDTVRGLEGMASREYFSLLPAVLKIPKEHLLAFSGRNRRPPLDPFNSLLSFGYSLLYKDCVGALLTVGLEPSFGFMHSPRSSAYPLALDLMDLFRLLLWDIPLIGSINRNQWNVNDFEITGKQVWLNSEGRRKAIALYEARKMEKWKHPVLDYSLSYARTIELEVRLLEKEWGQNPGLFAKLRLR